VVRQLLYRGADVNAEAWFGLTPLHVAAQNDRFNVISELIARGAKVNAKYLEHTPLDVAKSRDMEIMLRYEGAKTSEEIKQCAQDNAIDTLDDINVLDWDDNDKEKDPSKLQKRWWQFW
jgi:ankyrin repeat protein